MRKTSKKSLYENIMKNVGKTVKKALNENSLYFDDTPVGSSPYAKNGKYTELIDRLIELADNTPLDGELFLSAEGVDIDTMLLCKDIVKSLSPADKEELCMLAIPDMVYNSSQAIPHMATILKKYADDPFKKKQLDKMASDDTGASTWEQVNSDELELSRARFYKK